MNTPVGWYQYKFRKGVVFSRDGLGLNDISIEYFAWDDSVFSKRKTFRRTMLLHELSWTFLSSLESTRYMSKLSITENSVIIIDSMLSIRTTFSCIRNDGVFNRGVVICTPEAGRVIVTSYIAPEREYYSRFIKDFDNLVSSLKFSARIRAERTKRLHEVESFIAPKENLILHP